MSDPDVKDPQHQIPPPKPTMMPPLVTLVLSALAFVALLPGACSLGAVLAAAGALAGAWALFTYQKAGFGAAPREPIPPTPPSRPLAMATTDPDPKDPSRQIPPPRPLPRPVIPTALETAFDIAVVVTVAFGACSAATALAGLAVVAGLAAVVLEVGRGKRRAG